MDDLNQQITSIIRILKNMKLSQQRNKKRKSRSLSATKQRTKIPENKDNQRPVIGDIVEIIIKPYNLNKTVIGTVKRILTKKLYHSRGIKIMLEDGTVGRLIRVIKTKSR